MLGGPWLWGWRVDLGVFLLPTAAAGLLVLGARGLGYSGKTPEWAWLLLVLCVDVAHVWSTIFRTYLDPLELRRRPWLYGLVPLACWLGGVALHTHSSLLFWRVFAYVAVFHFIRQQAGWTAIYRARSGSRSGVERAVDEAAIYLGTGVPLLLWHVGPERPFSWFLDGDFIRMTALAWTAPLAKAALGAAVLAWLGYHGRELLAGRAVSLGKAVVVLTTVVSWYAGIVLASDDWAFTVLNVLPHGIPYFALLWAYAQARRKSAPRTPGSRITAAGFAPFFALLMALAFGEELLWDRAVWHDRPWFFGILPEVDARQAAHLLVPLLALPQATHYVLDAFIWRRGATGPEQAEALGFTGRPPRSAHSP